MEFQVTRTLGEIRSELAIRILEARESGRKVVGHMCSYFPIEMVLAAGAINVGLCGTTQDSIAVAERDLPVDQCPMVKSTYGRAVGDTCPLFHLADCVVGETTCDGRKKMYELMSRIKPMHVMDLPQKPEEQEARDHWVAEVRKLKAFIEEQLAVRIEDAALRAAIRQTNMERSLLKQIHELRKITPPPIMSLDLVGLSTLFGYTVDRREYAANLQNLLAELQQRIDNRLYACEPERPRVLWTGLGNSLGCDKVLRLVEECGAVVVCQEGCGGVTRLDDLIDEEADPIEAIADRYLKVTCSCMTPNETRFAQIDRLIPEYGVDGVLDLTWQSCHTFNIESHRVGELVKSKYGLPFLHIVTDYSQSDVENLRVRIEAFIEQMMMGKASVVH